MMPHTCKIMTVCMCVCAVCVCVRVCACVCMYVCVCALCVCRYTEIHQPYIRTTLQLSDMRQTDDM